MKNRTAHRYGRRFFLGLLLAIGVLGLPGAQWIAAQASSDAVSDSWARVRSAASYQFSGDIVQVTTPSATLTNVGRMSQTDRLYLQGRTSLDEQLSEIQLWAQAGNVLQDQDSVSVRVDHGITSVRAGNGAWQERESYTDGFAPNGDVMAYLQAARDVTTYAPESRAGVTFTRSTFRLDGPRFAAYMQAQIEQRLRAKGALPANAQLNVSDYYQGIEGNGELWVGQDGMPIREQLSLRFPEQNNETISATMTINFSQFTQLPAPTGFAGLFAMLRSYLPSLPQMGLLLLTIMMGIVLLRFSHSRKLYSMLAIGLIVSIVLGPLLSSLKIHSFLEVQAAQAATAKEERAQADQFRDARAALNTPSFDPHANPLAVMPPSASLQNSQQGASAPQAALIDDGTDSDNDGLTNFQEERVGTDPNFADSDEDGVPDATEVKGVAYGSQVWYLNPNDIDTNRDGLTDGQEWDRNNDGIPDDSDSDGTPDAFDSDNDNDGVPDAKDLAPFTKINATFSDATPFALTLKNFTTNTPTFVDFQLRPSNKDHLWFAFNVLDWPRDTAGQVRDIDGKTFADLAHSEGRNAAANESFGDMKLIPMLEIRMPDGGINMPARRDLTPYNITLNDYSANGSTKVAYVPLNILTDEKTGMRVAFGGRMRYLPSGSWPAAHQVRLAWVLQTLIDMPCDPQAANAAQQGCASDGYIHNVPQAVQTYYDDWTLTGMNIKEDHGASMVIAYEDPAVDTNLKDEPALTALSSGLDNAFLSARDQDNNGQRDIDLSEIVRRFHRASNAAVSEDQRWAIPNILNVERKNYSTFDESLSSTTMTETLRILNTHFKPVWQNDTTIKPLLLYAQESQARALGMDGLQSAANYVALSGNTLTFDMQPPGQTRAALVLSTHLHWTPYCAATAASPDWAACDGETWWNELERRSPDSAILPGDDPANTSLAAGRVMIMELYAMQLTTGITRIVQHDATIISGNYSKLSDPDLAGTIRSALSVGNTVVKTIASQVIMARFVNQVSVLEHLGSTLKAMRGTIRQTIAEGGTAGKILAKVGEILPNLKQNRLAGTGIILGAITLIGGLGTIVALNFFGHHISAQAALGGKIAFKVLVFGLLTYFSVISPLRTIGTWTAALKAAGQTASVLTMSAEVSGSCKAAGVIGSVIAVAITWGFFVYSMVSNQVSAFSPAFNAALAETIAATIYIIVLFVLSATVIGALIVGIIGLIDFILSAICELGVDALRTVPGMGGACFTLGNAAIKGLAYSIYNYSPMVDTTRSDLIVTGAPSVQLADPSKGYVAGNALTITLPVTTTIVHKNPDPKDGLLIYPYMWIFSADNLRTSTFKYSLTNTAAPGISVERNKMNGAWQDVREDHKYLVSPMYRGQANTTPPALANNVLPAGLNQSIPMTLNMGYAIPAYECWGLLILGVCYTRDLADSTSISMQALRYDIFPNSLDGFMALSAKGPGGPGLAWSTAFGSLQDADGDGLRASTQNGNDPGDSLPDYDNDGLADSYELQQRSEGLAYNAGTCDTDSDGLTDKQESQIGTNPANSDSDRDGLSDAQEVWHQRYNTATCLATNIWEGGWDVTINGSTSFILRVSSNPLLVDGDNDGISDPAERQLALSATPNDGDNRPYHPNVANVSPLTVATEIEDADGIVGLNQTFVYTTTAITRVALKPSPLAVTLPAALGGTTLNGSMPFDPLTFTSIQTTTQESQITVSGTATSSTQNIVSTVTGKPDAGGGDIIVSASQALVIDADAPSSALTSLQNDQYIQGGFPGKPVTIIIGGTASDNRSGVSKVEVSVNNGPWEAATGAASWTYPLVIDDGVFVIRTRATDNVGNVETPGAGISIRADGIGPSFNFLSVPATTIIPQRNANGQWTVSVGGAISDAQIGQFGGNGTTLAGSGLLAQSVELRIRRSDDSGANDSWQPVSINNGQWSATYQFPVGVANPTGSYWVDLHAIDLVGNQSENNESLVLDASAPIPTLSSQDSTRQVISNSITLNGTVNDINSSVGIDSLEAAIVPLDQVAPLADMVLHLALDEAAASQYYLDSSGYSNNAACAQLAACPTAGTTGRIDQALSFSGANPLTVADRPALNFGQSDSFSVQGWVKTTRGDNVILHKGSAQQRYRLSLLSNGSASFGLWNAGIATLVSGGPDLRDNQWHYIVGTLNRSSGQASLYVDGVVRASVAASGDFSNNDTLEIGGQLQVPEALPLFDGSLDDIAIFAHALSAAEVHALYSAADRQWLPTTLAQRGAGISSSSWGFTIPAGLEGSYQIDLRSKDMLGNKAVTPKVWRGVIDTLAPRAVLTVQPTGAVYFDSQSNSYRAAVQYVCGAQDQYLDEASFSCPGPNLPPATRSFTNDPILQSLFPDITIRSGMVISYTLWEEIPQSAKTMRVCDLNGNCTNATAQASIAVPVPGAPQAAVIAPTDKSFVASNGTLDAVVAAEADQPLKEVSLTLDGTLVNTKSFAQADAVKRSQYSVSITPNGEGLHTLVARATDWTGRVQTTLFPVVFTLDTQAPLVTLDSSPLTVADTYGPGSDILRFNGTASDSVGLASVQISINAAPFTDVNFGNGTWSTAQKVTNPEGKLLSVIVRATDLAGRVSEYTHSLQVDISTANPPDTSITAQPGNPTSDTSASFSFVGIAGERGIGGFACQLDTSDFVPCVSQQVYTNLSLGSHTFRVRAIDSQGYVDPSPASYTWTTTTTTPPPTFSPIYLPLVVKP